jgi:hypothetical protein
MLQPLNRIETMLRETYTQLAKGQELNRVSEFFGFRRPQYIEEDYWRSALNVALFSSRGTPGPIFRFLEEVFGEWVDGISTYSAVAISPNIMQFSGVSCAHEGRYVRINGDLYRSSTLRGSSHPNDIVFHAVDTMMFKKAAFTPGAAYTLKFLPFDIEEHGCEYRILIDSGILNFPKYYVPTNVAEDRAGGIPLSGHIMNFFSTVLGERYGNQEEGAYPIYLAAEEFQELFFDAIDMMLAAGVHERILVTTWCQSEASIYGSIFNRKVYGSTTPAKPDIIQPSRS